MVCFRKRDSFTVGNEVVTDFNDGSCVLNDDEIQTFCYNAYSGANLYVKRSNKGSDTCAFLPTRKDTVHGQILRKSLEENFIRLVLFISILQPGKSYKVNVTVILETLDFMFKIWGR